jgi:hypothetical protein
MVQLSKRLQPVVIVLLIAVIVINEVNDRRPKKESVEMRTTDGHSHEIRGEGDNHEEDMSWLSSLNATAKAKPQKFNNRASPIPQEEWARIDCQACIVGDGGADDGDLQEYQHRAPYALIVGAMKAGTSSLNSYLEEHSKIMRTKMKELHFYDFKFDNYTTTEGILRGGARKAYGEIYEQNVAFGTLKTNKNIIALDDSPRYLFWSERVPARVLCVTPSWVKILAILRNPIDRAFSQYNMFYSKPGKVQKKGVAFTFEEWIENDIEDMRNTGVLQDEIPPEEFRNSPEEEAAWKAYTRMGSHAPIGRGLYAIQLRQWFNAFKEAGKSLNDVLVIQSELMKEEPNLVYANILGFLGLRHEPLKDSDEKFVGKYNISLKTETRKMLELLYAPYNQELYELLGDDWTGVWDP